MIRLARRVIYATAWCTLAALAAPPLTTVQDVLYRADGTRFNGIAVISWYTFEAADTSNIGSNSVTVQIQEGNLRVQLVPNVGAIPSTPYAVRYNSDGKFQFDELWTVPVSSRPLRVRDVRAASQGPIQPPAQPLIQEADVVGLAGDLAARPVKGPAYAPGRAVTINSTGALDAVIGSLSDCVRVDGTSAPCAQGSGSALLFVDSAVLAGLSDGINTFFTLPSPPNPASSVSLFRNGILQRPTTDFSVSGSTVTMVTPPLPSDLLMASYRAGNEGTPGPQFADLQTPAGTVNGINATFSVSVAPNPSSSLLIYRNGVLQKLGLDYVASGNTVQFLSVSIPQPGDILLSSYRF